MERNVQVETNPITKIQKTSSLKIEKEVGIAAKIYIGTLARFIDYREGSYAMSSLKKITGTSGYLDQSDRWGCQMETFETCQTRGYLVKVEEECGCVPWALTSALPQKVNCPVLHSTLTLPTGWNQWHLLLPK